MSDKEYLQRAINNSRASYEQGNFPAGAVLVKDGITLAEAVSSPYPNLLHADGKAISAAHEKRGLLSGATLYVGMEPCLMCTSMAYWAGIRRIVYALPKVQVDGNYYESHAENNGVFSGFNEKIEFVLFPEYGNAVLEIIKEWEDKYVHK